MKPGQTCTVCTLSSQICTRFLTEKICFFDLILTICINKFIVIFINLKTNVLFYSSLFSPFFSLSFNTFLLSKNFNDFFLVFSVQRGKVQNKNQGELCADLPHLQVSCLVSILKDNYSPYPTIGCLVFTFLIKFHVFKDF